ncbi:PilN domain-containing protein [Desulforegula conservatrix]|uniref:PilN domain-containing protein n=1 Tax=Desulforegula conservatrix TaxID=153026 RepID=UPI00041E095E|nr:PilN domain-containing protein [Desulforegula conservatrix]
MIRINLLPFRAARRKENIRRQISIFFLGLILSILIMLVYSMMLGTKIGKLETKLAKTKEDLKIYEKKAKEVDEMKKQLELLKMKMDVIASLEKNRKIPLEMLDEMSNATIRNRMWLTELNSGSSLELKGFAIDNQTVADFMKNLEKSKFYSAINLKTIKQQSLTKGSKKGESNVDLRYFEVICEKKPENNQPKKTDQAKK